MDSFSKFLKNQKDDKLTKSNYYPSMVTRLVELPFKGLYITLIRDDFKWTKKQLVTNMNEFYYWFKLNMKQSCSGDPGDKDFKYFSYGEHGYDNDIKICLKKGMSVAKLMKEWKSLSESDWKDIRKNQFFKEFTIMLFHEYTHEKQEKKNTHFDNIEDAEKVKDPYGEYLSKYSELQAFAVESAFTKKTFGHYSPSIKIYRKYPMLWKFFKAELEKWK